MKHAVIVHGWNDSPQNAWFPWLAHALEAKGFEVVAPQLPEAAVPRIENWVPALATAVGAVDEHTYFIGHSLGCQTIARYIDTLAQDIRVGGAVFVAGFFTCLAPASKPERQALIDAWLHAPLDLAKVREHLLESAAIFSDNDPFVPLDNQVAFRDELGSDIIIAHAMGHFTGGYDKVTELPIVLEKVLEISGAAY